ncbi:MAG: DUF262 domain-containing protein, partial [Bacteroidetes bacterium]|nr:DUF262 domain-containing protein [Bacteroidota bacterium]
MPKVDTKVSELVDMVTRGELRLPEMQRGYVWTATRVRDLLDSLYRGYPSGTVLVWETDQDSPTRDLAIEQEKNIFATQKLLLDGQQRITSLVSVIRGEPVTVRNRKRPIEILFNVAHPDGPPLDVTEVDDDVETPTIDHDDEDTEDEASGSAESLQQRLGRRTFVVSSRQLLSIPTWIRVTDVFSGKSDWTILKPLGLQPDDPEYEKFSQRLQKLRSIRDYPYVMQVLERGMAYEEVAEIFVRVNSLGMKLRGSDLALAQVTARWKNSLKLFEEFADEIEEAWFTLDIGLLVRSMVVFATRQSRFKTVQNISTQQMQDAWGKAKDGIRFAVNFLRTNAAIEDESLLSSPFLIIALAAFGANRGFQLSRDEERGLLRWLLIANAFGRFSRGSTETILDQDLSLIFRNASVDELHVPLYQQFGRTTVDAQDFIGRSTRSPLFATTYLALKALGARDWRSGLGLSLTHQGKLHYIEFHHIFPKSLLARHGYEKSKINEIANLAFISGRANRAILSTEPKKYGASFNQVG